MILIKRTYINPEHVVAVEYEVDGSGLQPRTPAAAAPRTHPSLQRFAR